MTIVAEGPEALDALVDRCERCASEALERGFEEGFRSWQERGLMAIEGKPDFYFGVFLRRGIEALSLTESERALWGRLAALAPSTEP